MFRQIRGRKRRKFLKDPEASEENREDRVKDFSNNELSDLENLVVEEAKLKKMLEDKRQEIRKAIERLEGKMSMIKEEVEKMGLVFKHLFKNREMEKEEIVPLDGMESDETGEGGANGIRCEREDWELRLQSKEEENRLLKNRISELEEQLGIEREKKGQEVVGPEQISEEVPEGQ